MPKYQQLSHLERYTISVLLTHRLTPAEIARWLQRSPSTISRELDCNRCTSDGAYRSEIAIHYASGRRKRVHRGFRHSPIVWGVASHIV
jgi:IS30 family transposase